MIKLVETMKNPKNTCGILVFKWRRKLCRIYLVSDFNLN